MTPKSKAGRIRFPRAIWRSFTPGQRKIPRLIWPRCNRGCTRCWRRRAGIRGEGGGGGIGPIGPMGPMKVAWAACS